MNEDARIEDAQQEMYEWCLSNLPVGRRVTKMDEESIKRVSVSSKKIKKALHEEGRLMGSLI